MLMSKEEGEEERDGEEEIKGGRGRRGGSERGREKGHTYAKHLRLMVMVGCVHSLLVVHSNKVVVMSTDSKVMVMMLYKRVIKGAGRGVQESKRGGREKRRTYQSGTCKYHQERGGYVVYHGDG